MDAKKVQLIFERFAREQPTPRTELVHNSVFELLVAVILSAQATDRSVNKATADLFRIANTPEAILNLGLEKFQAYIKSIGLYRTKALNIMKTCALLIERHRSQVPNQREALEALPGVGRKSASVVLNAAFGQATMPVDTHIFRISERIGLTKGAKTPLQVEKQLLNIIPEKFLMDAHHWLVLHGRYVCKARKPDCNNCLIRDLCEYPNKTA